MSKKIDKSNPVVALRPQNNRIIPIKPRFNVGGKIDHYNGTWYVGKHGESILNGGLSSFVGVAGKQNQFKTTFARGIGTIAFGRMQWLNELFPETTFVNYSAYDTESQQEERRWNDLFRLPWYNFNGVDHINETELWKLSDVQSDSFNEYITEFIRSAKTKRDYGNSIRLDYPFIDQHGKNIRLPWPNFLDCDTISQARTDNQSDKMDDNGISDSGRNMIGMTGGKEKTYIIDEIPSIAIGGMSYFTGIVQMRDRISMDGKPLEKLFADLNQNIKFAGVPQNFHYLTLDFYAIIKAIRYMHSDPNKGPKWPRNGELREKSNPDLNQITMFNLRGKAGMSGLPIKLLCSQTQGYCPHLTMFDDLYTADFGILGNDRAFQIAFLPELTLTRTTVRDLIEENADLRTALELQSSLYYETIVDSIVFHITGLLPDSPMQLYENISKQYDWNNVILKTRSWYTPMNDKHPIPYLSILDLLKMNKGIYKPYWLNKK